MAPENDQSGAFARQFHRYTLIPESTSGIIRDKGAAASSSHDPREIRPGIKRLVRLELTTSTLEAWRSTY
jgi:hypothetical protein